MRRLITLVCACAAGGAAFAGAATASTAHHDCYRTRTGWHDCDGRRPPSDGPARVTRVSAWDREYLKTSLEGDLFEVRGGKLAKTKSSDAAVLKLANILIADHTKSFKDGAKLARKLGVEVPSEPTPSEQWELKMVSALSGSAFNHWYSSLEVYDHRQDIQETTDEIKDGTNSDVRDDARTELPTLRKHLRLAKAALKANP